MIGEPMKTPIYFKDRQTFINLDSVFDFCSFQLTLESGVLRSVDLKTKIVERYLLPKNKRTNLFFYPDNSEILETLNQNSSFKYF